MEDVVVVLMLNFETHYRDRYSRAFHVKMPPGERHIDRKSTLGR